APPAPPAPTPPSLWSEPHASRAMPSSAVAVASALRKDAAARAGATAARERRSRERRIVMVTASQRAQARSGPRLRKGRVRRLAQGLARDMRPGLLDHDALVARPLDLQVEPQRPELGVDVGLEMLLREPREPGELLELRRAPEGL